MTIILPDGDLGQDARGALRCWRANRRSGRFRTNLALTSWNVATSFDGDSSDQAGAACHTNDIRYLLRLARQAHVLAFTKIWPRRKIFQSFVMCFRACARKALSLPRAEGRRISRICDCTRGARRGDSVCVCPQTAASEASSTTTASAVRSASYGNCRSRPTWPSTERTPPPRKARDAPLAGHTLRLAVYSSQKPGRPKPCGHERRRRSDFGHRRNFRSFAALGPHIRTQASHFNSRRPEFLGALPRGERLGFHRASHLRGVATLVAHAPTSSPGPDGSHTQLSMGVLWAFRRRTPLQRLPRRAPWSTGAPILQLVFDRLHPTKQKQQRLASLFSRGSTFSDSCAANRFRMPVPFSIRAHRVLMSLPWASCCASSCGLYYSKTPPSLNFPNLLPSCTPSSGPVPSWPRRLRFPALALSFNRV